MRLALAALLVLLAVPALYAEEDQARARYLELHAQAGKWRQNLFGSRRYHARQLRQLLIGLIGEEIETGYAWTLIRPAGDGAKRVRCLFDHDAWLVVQGGLDDAFPAARAFAGSPEWPGGEMMALRGRVRGFVLNDHAVPGKVVLFMSGIKVVFRNGQQSEMQKNLE